MKLTIRKASTKVEKTTTEDLSSTLPAKRKFKLLGA